MVTSIAGAAGAAKHQVAADNARSRNHRSRASRGNNPDETGVKLGKIPSQPGSGRGGNNTAKGTTEAGSAEDLKQISCCQRGGVDVHQIQNATISDASSRGFDQ